MMTETASVDSRLSSCAHRFLSSRSFVQRENHVEIDR